MGILALSWAIGLVATLVAAVSAVRVLTTTGEARFAAGGDLMMGLCMAAMALPTTAGWYVGHGVWWAVAFGVLGLGGVAMAVKPTRTCGWKHGRHWVHLVVGSFGMVIMTLAMTSTPSGPVLALGGHAMADMPGMANRASTTGTHQTDGMESMEGTGSMAGTDSMRGTDMSGMANAGDSGSVWRWVTVALAVYFALSIGAALRAGIRGTGGGGARAGSRFRVGRRLLAMPDTVLVFLVSLTISVWDKSRRAQGVRASGHSRRRKPGAAPDVALAVHIGMGGTMSAMLLMMAA